MSRILSQEERGWTEDRHEYANEDGGGGVCRAGKEEDAPVGGGGVAWGQFFGRQCVIYQI